MRNLLLISFAATIMLVFSSRRMIGPGLYHVIHIQKCDGSEEDHDFTVDVFRRKYNRTHDAFNSTIEIKKDFDHSYSIKVVICKYVDGECKLYHVLYDNDIIHFMTEYAERNVLRFLAMAGVDPPTFPISPRTLNVYNYIYDYEELPSYGLYGTYEAHCMMMDRLEQLVGCLDMTVVLERCKTTPFKTY